MLMLYFISSAQVDKAYKHAGDAGGANGTVDARVRSSSIGAMSERSARRVRANDLGDAQEHCCHARW